MKVDRMVGLLSDLHHQHKLLLDLSVQKTEALKKNDIKVLDKLLSEENKCIQTIERIENDRVREVEVLLNTQGIVVDENPSLSQLLRFYNHEGQAKLIQVQNQLKQTIQQLQEQNELNHELTRQSLQFVNASLSLMEPKKPTANYRRPGQTTKQDGYQKSRSIFDSKA
ncbi:flagellar protein FlgN [Pseudalkalibacillus salsuginis]|uniref:flagellar protein FlgN n=1 Tax=Pseudalkalibacillus salsuginis TaxID=2910972 RepID=UPI001F179CEE|nr:flagellar protein FlgN [Pseudalkalibacillus salsuginis]MCF6410146.1 flagellar protein FlgN [Pseudalkalibacillus salsuginis]